MSYMEHSRKENEDFCSPKEPASAKDESSIEQEDKLIGQTVVIEGGQFRNCHIGKRIEYIVNVGLHGVNSVAGVVEEESYNQLIAEFHRRIKIHLTKIIGNGSKLPSQPIIMILDTEGSKQLGSQDAVGEDTNTLFGRDIRPVGLDELHSDHNDKPTRHVMILGEAGAGKTTLTKTYSARAAAKNIRCLDNIELVHFVNAMFLQSDSPAIAFDLMFTQQMSGDPDTELRRELAEAGERWINENADKMFIAIDGLDQLTTNIGGQRHPNIDASTPSRSDHILANIMSGKLWRGARVLTSSRWNVFWNLMAPQKPDKVVGLRGFDDENMRSAIMGQIKDPSESETLLDNLQNAPKLLALCRNPLFLQYTSEIFQNNANKMPGSISGLMSALFIEFIHSSHSSKPELDGLTKLAYQLTLENRFYSSSRYLNKLKVDPNKLKGFLSCGANLPPGHEVLGDDKTFVFTHQTLQEFCCALHITNLGPTEVRTLAATTLQESRMEMTRKLFYGIIMDYRNTDQLRRYLEDRSCSIDECRDILLRQLHALIPGKTIRDIAVVHLLDECGNAIIQSTKNHVQKIFISQLGLLPNDQITLASTIKQLSPLNTVFIREITFNTSLDDYLKDFPKHAESCQVYRLTLQDEALTGKTIDQFLTTLREAGCKSMGLTSCNLTGEKIHMITERCKALQIKMRASKLSLYINVH